MKKTIWVIILSTIFGLTALAEATLYDRGGGLIYCDSLDITLLQNANYGAGSIYDDGFNNADGLMTWGAAILWADNLVYYDSVRNIYWNDWRLPSPLNHDGSGPDSGYNVVSSEMGHIYYTELVNKAEEPLSNTGPFINIQPQYDWSGKWCNTEYALDTDRAWYFDFGGGDQNPDNKDGSNYAWAVHDGDVAASVPEPTTKLLFLSLILGIAGVKMDRQRHG